MMDVKRCKFFVKPIKFNPVIGLKLVFVNELLHRVKLKKISVNLILVSALQNFISLLKGLFSIWPSSLKLKNEIFVLLNDIS